MTRWVILGCGYTGRRIGDRLLAEKECFTATTRSEATLAELRGRWDDDGEATLTTLGTVSSIESLIEEGAVVVNSIPPSDEGVELEVRIARACSSAGARRLIYLSSTGVYGRCGIDPIDEQTPVGPIHARGERRLRAEQTIRNEAAALGLECVALRIAAIYGPDRGVHVRLARGEYRIFGDGQGRVSRVHVDDLVSAIVAAGRATPLQSDVYCIADDLPSGSREHADGVAAMMGLSPPPTSPESEASASLRAMHGADRSISNRRAARELGWSLRYPSWREGTAALIATP
ncbi:MAG: NAD-dependent epimerase/dehydratase family protein [Nannocystaceae bacterium]